MSSGKRARLTITEYALLGMIATSPDASGEVHGYELHRHLTEGVVARIIRIEPGMIYHYLKKLSAADLITTRTEEQERRPNRHVHAITAAGKAAFHQWMGTPVHATRDVRLDFLLKLWFARRLEPALATRLLHEQRAVLASLESSMLRQQAPLDTSNDDERYLRAVLDLRLAQNRAARAWLDSMEDG